MVSESCCNLIYRVLLTGLLTPNCSSLHEDIASSSYSYWLLFLLWGFRRESTSDIVVIQLFSLDASILARRIEDNFLIATLLRYKSFQPSGNGRVLQLLLLLAYG